MTRFVNAFDSISEGGCDCLKAADEDMRER
ncbi:hypothetical protein MGA5115_01360 [Marinomonas gallaica]|uniref:Uncharacterized protein n=1 Tax=Marinomonas gallaica TaxID=1806667 RepID=A0A1C3JPU1_9GAMM|nr:hypothetical protein MGA5115_01360 [Marinomonas gallaica]SBT22415.1 hypothetical protein MGA5116_03035 [Marinomonas gallaica]